MIINFSEKLMNFMDKKNVEILTIDNYVTNMC